MAALLVFLTGSGAAAAPPSDPAPSAAPAERGTLEEVVAEHGVVTVPEAPSFADYVHDLGTALLGWFLDLLNRLAPNLGTWVVGIASVGAKVVFALALALLAVLLFRVLRDQLARRAPGAAAAVTLAENEAREDRTRRDWAGELRRRLAAGDVAAACEALWWWLALSLAGDAVDGSWTSRELLARTGRRDLAPPVRRLESMVFAAAAPAVDDVRRLWNELEETVG